MSETGFNAQLDSTLFTVHILLFRLGFLKFHDTRIFDS